MLTRILTISGLTIRTAIRSRVFAVLSALVVLGCVGLPLMIKSDGTAAGEVRLFIHYTFGLAAALLAIAAAFSAAGAVALEVSGGQMHVLLTKPVHAGEVWLGKWLGLMTINLVMLALAGVLIYSLLRYSLRSAALPAEDRQHLREEVLSAHRGIAPELPAVQPGASGERPRMFVIPPGGTQSWVFQLPPRSRPDPVLFLQFRFVTSRFERQMPVSGEWLFFTDDEASPIRVSGSYTPHVNNTLSARSARGGKLPSLKPGQRLRVTYRNVDTAAPVTVLFATDTGLRLLLNEGSFESNFLRALLLVLARLAFCTALGLTCGALFSFPVAVFTALAFLLITSFSPLAESGLLGGGGLMAEGGSAAGFLAAVADTVLRGVIQLAHWITPPLARFEPLDFLPSGVFIPWLLVLHCWGVLVLAYGGVLAAGGIWLFSRREMGLAA